MFPKMVPFKNKTDPAVNKPPYGYVNGSIKNDFQKIGPENK